MNAGSVGFYGKLPMVGDFITRRLPKGFIDPLDQWMQNSIAASQDKLGNNWLDLYLTSPIWRFAFQAGICGDSAWVGIIMPSVDKVGRYYPFVLACKIDADKNPALILSCCSNWFERLEDISLAGLEGNYSLERFNQIVLGMGKPLLLDNMLPDEQTEQALITHIVSIYELTDPVKLSEGLMMASLRDSVSNEAFSLWGNNGSVEQRRELKVFNGLPSKCDYLEMMI
ncbi:MAG: type VI secretion system-associated protein TagF [Methylococcales bacterium]|nr:type VI secretion system-associated protein TagF [Methylococcales bacterium]